MRHVCFCKCHVAPVDRARAFEPAGVDVRDVVEAAVACVTCQNAHAPALLNTALANEPCVVLHRGVQVITPEGKTLTWEQYQQELNARVDSWRQRDQGEGPEA